MKIRGITHEFSRTHLAESNTRAVVGVDVGCDFKDESGKLFFLGFDHTLYCLRGAGRWRNFDKAVEQLLHTEVVERRAEEYGSDIGRTLAVDVKIWVNPFDEFEVFA